MEKEKIKDYFIECKNSHKKENIDTAVWNLESSSLNDVDIKKMEEEIHIVFPKEYRAYIMTAAHQFTVLKGNFDNFFLEDDVDVELKIVPQPYHEELKYIREMLKENMILVRQSYLPIGEFDEDGYLCIDLKGNNEIVWIPFENCIGFTEREQFEQEQISIFHEFDDYIKCFFGGAKYIIEDE